MTEVGHGSGEWGSTGQPVRRVWVARSSELVEQAVVRRDVLDAGERERHARLGPRADPDTWLVAHVVLRLVLGRLLGAEPGRLKLSSGGHPDPRRGDKPWCGEAPFLDFSLSHTPSLSCVAVSSHGLVGVDVEAISRFSELPRLVARTTTAEERRALEEGDPATRARRFLELWTRKEACAKAVGLGLAASFSGFSVDAEGPHPRSALGPGDLSWSCRALELPEGYVGSVAFSPGAGDRPVVVRVSDLDDVSVATGPQRR